MFRSLLPMTGLLPLSIFAYKKFHNVNIEKISHHDFIQSAFAENISSIRDFITSKRDEINSHYKILHHISDKHLKLRNTIMKNANYITINTGRIFSYSTCHYAANSPYEDSFDILNPKNNPNDMLFGIYDGHSGTAASKFCQNELISFLLYLNQINPKSHLLNKSSFLFADDAFLTLATKENRIKDGLSGACALVTHISGNNIEVANIGDCRCVIGRKEENNNYSTISLSKDHNLKTNENERERLLINHINEYDVIHNYRVKGRLEPTRGIGDGKYKRKEFFNEWNKGKHHKDWREPYTTAEPDILRYELDERDEFMILSTDGLYQNFNNESVVNIVGEYLNEIGSVKKSHLNISGYLIEKALIRASENAFGRWEDDTNIDLLNNLPKGSNRRSIHDDLTVIVIYFGKENIEKKVEDRCYIVQEPETLKRLRKYIR